MSVIHAHISKVNIGPCTGRGIFISQTSHVNIYDSCIFSFIIHFFLIFFYFHFSFYFCSLVFFCDLYLIHG